VVASAQPLILLDAIHVPIMPSLPDASLTVALSQPPCDSRIDHKDLQDE